MGFSAPQTAVENPVGGRLRQYQENLLLWVGFVISVSKFSNDFLAKKLPRDVNPQSVFACNELRLEEISVYGFDYDFTLACYKPAMDYLLYDLGRNVLVNKFMVCFCIWNFLYNFLVVSERDPEIGVQARFRDPRTALWYWKRSAHETGLVSSNPVGDCLSRADSCAWWTSFGIV